MISAAKLIRDEVIKKHTSLKAMVKRVKQQGYELIPSPTLEGVLDIGFPIVNQLGQLAGALMVSSLKYRDQSDRLNTEELLGHIGTAASEISLALGYDGEKASG